jgi:hypothetical protein
MIQLSLSQRIEARDWLKDCDYPNVDDLSDGYVYKLVNGFYDGGIRQFAADTQALA